MSPARPHFTAKRPRWQDELGRCTRNPTPKGSVGGVAASQGGGHGFHLEFDFLGLGHH